jgi:RNA-binding protein
MPSFASDSKNLGAAAVRLAEEPATEHDQEDAADSSSTLTSQQRSRLRSLGHHLDVVVHVGKDGLTGSLCAAVEQALDQHELLKVKLSENAPMGRHELALQLAAHCNAALVQVLGRTLLLYRRRPDSDPRPHVSLA